MPAMPRTRIALIGDYNASVTAHVAIPPALELAARALHTDVEPVWIPTTGLSGPEAIRALLAHHLPTRTEGAISAISLARIEGVPLLGTCGGFRHAPPGYPVPRALRRLSPARF